MPFLKFRTEVCVDDYDSAIKAATAGANRIELCASLVEGGITPSYSLMKKVCSRLSINVRVMIRPRPGDFIYGDNDFELMKLDIEHAKEAGASGVVFGILNTDGTVDVQRCKELIQLAKPMQVTFHRAFDLTPDPFLAMEKIISLGVDTILTSGQSKSAEDGLEVIRELIKRAEGRVDIMVGSGVSASNILLLKEAGATTFHFSSRKVVKAASNINIEEEILTSENKPLSLYHGYEFDNNKFEKIESILKKNN